MWCAVYQMVFITFPVRPRSASHTDWFSVVYMCRIGVLSAFKSNGSGCGNEFRSESPMGRKYIIDSLLYWATEYSVDGFRFDLCGLIDADTLAIAASKLHALDPNIVLYGEPWCGGLTPIRSTEKGMQRGRGFGVFNNTFRDALRGSHFHCEETFVMDGGRIDEVKNGILGSIADFADSPVEVCCFSLLVLDRCLVFCCASIVTLTLSCPLSLFDLFRDNSPSTTSNVMTTTRCLITSTTTLGCAPTISSLETPILLECIDLQL
jgi:hypothetical protein